MYLLKKFWLVWALTLVSFSSFAQKDSAQTNLNSKPKKPLSDRIFVGGNLALTFGSITFVGAAPMIGYKVSDKWSVGVGGSYYYFRDNIYDVSASIYGGLLMSRYLLWKGLYAEGDFEENNQLVYALDLQTGDLLTQREWIPSLLLGGGYSQAIGDRSAFFISILYDVIQNPNSQYYRIPVIRAGIGIGL